MKELFKAKELHEEIIKVDKHILKLEKLLDDSANNNLSVKLKVRLLKEKVEEIKSSNEEEESIFSAFMYRSNSKSKNKKEWDFENKLSSTEFLIMFSSLLRYKQESRDKLINQFNKLSLKLKI